MSYESPEKEILEKYIEDGLGVSYISKKHNVSIPVVKRWLRENELVIRPYQGLKHFKTDEDEQKFILNAHNLANRGFNVSEISRKLNVPRIVINYYRKLNKLNIQTQFDIWESKYEELKNNRQYYFNLNKNKTLKDISYSEDVSLEQLKKLFKEYEVPVKMHSHNKSKGELECKEFIESLDFRCYSAMFDRTYEIDCYVREKLFGLEYCGEYWHSYTPEKDNKYYHQNKYKFCAGKNFTLMTIFETEWRNKRDIIESMIKSRLGVSNRIMARKCQVEEISSREAKKFHEVNHISGYVSSKINIGLVYNNEIVMVLSLSKSRYDKKYEYEITRFSCIKGYNIVGGLGKCFSYFKKEFDPKSCMTYADLRFGEGRSYKKIGFKEDGITSPNYFYIKKNGDNLESRLKYQKHKLKTMPYFDENKTEYEIMSKNNYYRVYDCGNMKYIWKKENETD